MHSTLEMRDRGGEGVKLAVVKKSMLKRFTNAKNQDTKDLQMQKEMLKIVWSAQSGTLGTLGTLNIYTHISKYFFYLFINQLRLYDILAVIL